MECMKGEIGRSVWWGLGVWVLLCVSYVVVDMLRVFLVQVEGDRWMFLSDQFSEGLLECVDDMMVVEECEGFLVSDEVYIDAGFGDIGLFFV